MRSANPSKFLTQSETADVNAAIKAAEAKTAAEIKVVIARYCWDDIKAKAASLFKRLQLDKTEQRNCVMLLVITTNREFLIYGDQGIHEKVGQDFWDDALRQILEKFRKDEFGEGLSLGVSLAGEKLAEHFPHRREDVNEISDEIVYAK